MKPGVQLAPHHKAHIGLVPFKQCSLISITRKDRTRTYTVSPARGKAFHAWLAQLHADVAAGRSRCLWPSGEFLPGGRYSGFLRLPEVKGANHG